MDNNPTTGSGQAGSGQGNNFFNGFLLGALVGAAVVFLLGTKKGKRLLKAISEEGVENISNILEEAQPSPRLRRAGKILEKESFAPKKEFAVKENSLEKPKVRRFFRGISKHVN